MQGQRANSMVQGDKWNQNVKFTKKKSMNVKKRNPEFNSKDKEIHSHIPINTHIYHTRTRSLVMNVARFP